MTLEEYLRDNPTQFHHIRSTVKGGEVCITVSNRESTDTLNYMVRGNELFPFPGPTPKPEPADVTVCPICRQPYRMGNL